MSEPTVPPPPPPLWSDSARRSLTVLFFLAMILLGYRISGRPLQPAHVTHIGILDLNSCTSAELEQLPGVGPRLAKLVVDHRRSRGGFQNLDDLRQVQGFGPTTIDRIRPYFRAQMPDVESEPEPPPAQPLEPERLIRKKEAQAPAPPASPSYTPGSTPKNNPNTMTVEQWQAMPGIGPVLAKRIVENRAAAGPFRQLDDLRRVGGIGVKRLDQLRDLLVFEAP